MAVGSLLILCQGNICRSPMAEALFANALPGSKVSSAGLGALVGYPADPLAIQLMSSRDLNINNHIARQVSFHMVRESDIVLTMSLRQKEHTLSLFSFARGRVFSIGEREDFEVIDPYRQGLPVFELSLSQIDRGVKTWLPILSKI